MNKITAIFICAFVACLNSDAFAASSVRILGAGTATPTGASTAPLQNANKTTTITRKSSVPLTRRVTTAATTTASNTGATGNVANTDRVAFSPIKLNVQKAIKTSNGTPATTTGNSAAITELMQRLDAIQAELDALPTTASLQDYYTKTQVDAKLDDLETLQTTVENLTTQVTQIQNSGTGTNITYETSGGPQVVDNVSVADETAAAWDDMFTWD